MAQAHFTVVLTAAFAMAAGMGTAGVASAQATTETTVPAAPTVEKPQQFLYMLRLVPRLYDDHAWTEADKAAVTRHFERLKRATDAGQVILAGRTREPGEQTFGIVVFEATDADAARSFMEGDPAVQAGVMTATLHPYAVALLRSVTPGLR